jgi:hypothetical protein
MALQGVRDETEEGRRGRKRARSSKRKAEVVLRLLRGEALDTVSREVRVTAAALSQWRDEFLAASQAGLKARARAIRICAYGI